MTHLTQLKVLLVISIVLLFSSCKLEKNDDFLIVENIIKKYKKKSSYNEVILDSTNNNSTVINFITKYKQLFIENKKDLINGFKIENDLVNISKIDFIFNNSQFEEYLRQDTGVVSIWNKEILNTFSNKDYSRKNVIKISKPIYSLDKKYSLIYVNKVTKSYILIYQKNNEEWLEYKLVSPNLIQSKVNTFNYN